MASWFMTILTPHDVHTDTKVYVDGELVNYVFAIDTLAKEVKCYMKDFKGRIINDGNSAAEYTIRGQITIKLGNPK